MKNVRVSLKLTILKNKAAEVFSRLNKHNTNKKEHILERMKTYIRLLGGIFRPSLNQVTCGWGKLRMRGAGTTAPSPWETDWVRSPSSKLPITTGKNTMKNNQKAQFKSRGIKTNTSPSRTFLFLSLTFSDLRAALCSKHVTWSCFDGQSSVAMVSAADQEKPWRKHDVMSHKGTLRGMLNWVKVIFFHAVISDFIELCSSKDWRQQRNTDECQLHCGRLIGKWK